MKYLFSALVSLLAPVFASAEMEALPAFRFTDVTQLHAQKVAIAEPTAHPADVIAKNHLFIQAGNDVLFGYAQTQEQFAEAAAYWAAVLSAAGIQPGAPDFDSKSGFFNLPYRTTDGRRLRAFLADAHQFPPKDDAGLRADMAATWNVLSAAGLTPVSARVINLDTLVPTYSILYLVKPEAIHERETQLRLLNTGEDLDADLIEASGVTVVQTPKPWLLVYVGPELGYVRLFAKTPADLARRLAKRKSFLIGLGKRMIGEKLVPLDDVEYRFGADLIFFQ